MITPLTTSSASVMSPLTTTGLAGSSTSSTLLQQVKVNAAEKMDKKMESISRKYQTSLDRVDSETDRLIKYMAEVGNAQMAVDNGLESIEKAEKYLIDLRGEVAALREHPGDAMHREEFDKILSKLNSDVNMYGAKFNPVGRVDRTNWEANDIEYQNGVNTRARELSGHFIGSDFRIMVDDGTYYYPDLDSRVLEQYNDVQPTSNARTDKSFSMINGMTVTSYDRDSGAITFEGSSGGETTVVNGTVELGGLQIAGSWAYNGFQSDEDFDNFKADIARAEAELTMAKSQIITNQSIIQKDDATLDKMMDDLDDDRRETMTDQMREEIETQMALEREYQAMVRNLQAAQSQQSNYVSVFASAIASSPFLNTTA